MSTATQSIIRRREGDIMVKIAVETEPAIIAFADILAATRLEEDEDYDPWDGDGFEHEVHEVSYGSAKGLPEEADVEEMAGYIWTDAGRRVVVTVDPRDTKDWGSGHRGCSRQVEAEMKAMEVQRSLKYICDWYEGNRHGYGVVCNFKGHMDSCWGYDDEEYAESQREEHALIVAHELEAENYTVTGKPVEQQLIGNRWRLTPQQQKAEFRHNLKQDCWPEYKTCTSARRKAEARRQAQLREAI